MTVAEYMQAVEREEAKLSEIFLHFNADEIEAYYAGRDLPALQERVEAFYRGGLFTAQTQSFERWCDENPVNDRRRASDFRALQNSTKTKHPEIERFMFMMVDPWRTSIESQAREPEKLERNRLAWVKRVDDNGWRHWPKVQP